jgi:hypothetical protein
LEHEATIEDQDEEVEFRLFAPKKDSRNGTVTRFRIHSPASDDRPPGLVNPERPRNHYFRDSLSPEAEQKIQLAAVSGEEILERSRTPYPGCLMPWRVTIITTKGSPISTPDLNIVEEKEGVRKKKRKGKKTRIAIRQKHAKERELLEQAKAEAAEKELRDKMKKAKRNRDKKYKKRARDKLKKLNEEGAGNDVAGGDSGQLTAKYRNCREVMLRAW